MRERVEADAGDISSRTVEGNLGRLHSCDQSLRERQRMGETNAEPAYGYDCKSVPEKSVSEPSVHVGAPAYGNANNQHDYFQFCDHCLREEVDGEERSQGGGDSSAGFALQGDVAVVGESQYDNAQRCNSGVRDTSSVMERMTFVQCDVAETGGSQHSNFQRCDACVRTSEVAKMTACQFDGAEKSGSQHNHFQRCDRTQRRSQGGGGNSAGFVFAG